MPLHRDDCAASPLTVVLVVVLIAVAVTSALWFAFDDDAPPSMEVQEVEGGFEVTDTGGRLNWDELQLRLLDAAGEDHAERFLEMPSGEVEAGDRIGLAQPLPGGRWLLVAQDGDRELVRLVVRV